VVCWSAGARERFGAWGAAAAVSELHDQGPGCLFALDRPRSFVLSGSARWEGATPKRVTLTDVVPDASGYVILSLHYQDGLRVYPSYIKLNDKLSVPDPTGQDPINHVRLGVPGPVPRVTLEWEHP
jgi:hypothetical protein